MNPWRISFDDYNKHCQQFLALKPIQGFITGDQARVYFMQFGLPSTLLAHIWNLSDLNRDGRLDCKEFSIAMHLIGKAVAGTSLPQILPESMKQEPTASFYGGASQFPSVGGVPSFGSSSLAPVGMLMSASPVPMSLTQAPSPVPSNTARTGVDWSFPQSSKLKFSQNFNTIDKSKTGFLSGIQARNILSQSGLPNPILAQIWNLSDLDKDGQLSCDEYCLAMFLIEKLKSGEVSTLPVVLPLETISSLSVAKQRTTSIGSDGGAVDPNLTASILESKFAVTFEDKRRENFDRGQAELERRRQILLEQERREREERERKEREEAEKRERERQELERRRQAELEQQLARQREEEIKRKEEYMKLIEQREAARRELEKQRQIEIERIRFHDLQVQRQVDRESVDHLCEKQTYLRVQLNVLNDRSSQLDNALAEAREQIVKVTSDIEHMKNDRDLKLQYIDNIKRKHQELNVTAGRQQMELRSLNAQRSQTPNFDESLSRFSQQCKSKSLNLENLNQSLQEIENEIQKRKPLASNISKMTLISKELINNDANQNKILVEKIIELQRKLATLSNKRPSGSTSEDAWQPTFDESPWPPNVASKSKPENGAQKDTQQGHDGTVKYRALYEFAARSDDELSFQPGDVILVFQGHTGEPGWLAGQIKDKVGWFPEAFAEPLDAAAVSDPFTDTSSPQHATGIKKLESINEESAEKDEENRSTKTTNINGTSTSANLPINVTALFQWKAKKDNHLSFNKGDIIKVIEMQEMWWMGELEGKTGWFPKSYVKLADVDRRKSDAFSLVDKKPSVKLLSRQFESQEFPSQETSTTTTMKPNSDWPSSGTGASMTTIPTIRPSFEKGRSQENGDKPPLPGQWYVAVYPFPEMEPGDLQFGAGEKIFVTQQDGEWWTGECNDRQGMFPANYVQKIESTESNTNLQSKKSIDEYSTIHKGQKSIDKTPSIELQSPTSPTTSHHEAAEIVRAVAAYKATGGNQLSLEAGDLIKLRSKSPTGWWEGELQQKSDNKSLEKKIGWFPGNYVISLGKKDSLKSQSSADGTNMRTESQDSTKSLESGRVMAMFDYVAQQDDELSVKRGDILVILEKTDEDWWKGETVSGQQGLLPANYVQSFQNRRESKIGVKVTKADDADSEGRNRLSENNEKLASKRSMYCQELLHTERNYLGDLQMIREVFYKVFEELKVLSNEELKLLFLNWDDLIKTSKVFQKIMKQYGEERLGRAICESESFLSPAFLLFFRDQQNSLDFLESKMRLSKDFSSIHQECCQHPAARGLPLSHFLLIPITRITKYPLVLKEILKYTPADHCDYQMLSKAEQLFKKMCDQVNQLASETDNLQMLYWCQNHIKCDSLQPKFIFHSETNYCSLRKILHFGVIFKAKSNRLLIGLLFNDIFLLTTPDEPIDKPDEFRLTKQADLTLSMYKHPVLLYKSSLQMSPNLTGVDANDETLFVLNNGESIISLKAWSSNGRLLWTKQLEKAIKLAKENYAKNNFLLSYGGRTPKTSSSSSSPTIGRLLIEIVALRNLAVPSESKHCPLWLFLVLGDKKFSQHISCQPKDDYLYNIPNTVSNASLLTTQFSLAKTDETFEIFVYLENQYSPHLCVAKSHISLADMIKMSASQKNPAVKQLQLINVDRASSSSLENSVPALQGGLVIVKFVVQMLDNNY